MLPKEKMRRVNNHLAEGEVTGHFHDAVGTGVAVWDRADGVLLEAPNGAEITHQEHKAFQLAPGDYDVSQVLEYDHFAEEARVIQD